MTHDSVQIRLATAADAAVVLAFLEVFRAERHHGVFVHTGSLPGVEEEEAWIQSLLDHDTSNLWLACEGARVVGLLDFHGHRHPQLAHGGALGTSVLSSCRGQGLGTRLMQALIEWASGHQSLTRIELEVFSNNTQAIAFYERQGFVREGARVGAVIVSGQPRDIVRMALGV